MIKKVRQHITQNEPLLFEQQLARQARLSASRARCSRGRSGGGAGRGKHARQEIEDFPKSAKWKRSATSRASRPGTTRSIWACIRWAPAP